MQAKNRHVTVRHDESLDTKPVLEGRKDVMKLELTPEEGILIRSAAERYLRDLRLELADAGEIEGERTRWDREKFILSLLKKLKG